MSCCRSENSHHQETHGAWHNYSAPGWANRLRDEENCFRFAEVGIPAFSEVVVVCKPEYTPPAPSISGGGGGGGDDGPQGEGEVSPGGLQVSPSAANWCNDRPLHHATPRVHRFPCKKGVY